MSLWRDSCLQLAQLAASNSQNTKRHVTNSSIKYKMCGKSQMSCGKISQRAAAFTIFLERRGVCVSECVVEWKWKIVFEHFHAANKDDNLAARRKIMKWVYGWWGSDVRSRFKAGRKVNLTCQINILWQTDTHTHPHSHTQRRDKAGGARGKIGPKECCNKFRKATKNNTEKWLWQIWRCVWKVPTRSEGQLCGWLGG